MMEQFINKVICCDCRDGLKALPEESVSCCISSPPYFGLRNYQLEPSVWDDWTGCLGLEPTIELYIKHLCDIYDDVKRVLRKDGTCWVNLGDSYSGSGGDHKEGQKSDSSFQTDLKRGCQVIKTNLPAKSLCLIPERFAIEMVNRGWILRSKIVWHKPSCMPSSANDRFTVDWEAVFFFVKSKEKSNDIKEWLPKQLRPEEASWLAGIVDGEGTIGVRHSKNLPLKRNDTFGAYITVSNSCKEIIERCLSVTGAGTIKDAGCSTNLKMYRWEAYHNKAVAVIAEIYPYLIAKKEQAKVAIAIQKTNYHRGSPKGSNKGQERLSQKELDEKTRLWLLCKSLNQRQVSISNLPEPNLNRYSGCEDYFFEQQFEPYECAKPESISYRPSGKSDSRKDRPDGIMPAFGDDGFWKPDSPLGRNKRCVWSIPTEPNGQGVHFACFPRKLVEPMVKSGCPEYICNKCGKPREKIYEKGELVALRKQDARYARNALNKNNRTVRDKGWNTEENFCPGLKYKQILIGYTDCGCNAGFRKGIVLDIFSGLSTVASVAYKLDRDYIMFEQKKEYCTIAAKRLAQEKMQMKMW